MIFPEYINSGIEDFMQLNKRISDKRNKICEDIKRYLLETTFEWKGGKGCFAFIDFGSISLLKKEFKIVSYLSIGENRFTSDTWISTNFSILEEINPISCHEFIESFKYWELNTKEKNQSNKDFAVRVFKRWKEERGGLQ